MLHSEVEKFVMRNLVEMKQEEFYDKLDWLRKFDLKNWNMRQEIKKRERGYTYKIELGHTYIQIHNYDLGDCPQLEARLTAVDRMGKISWQNFIYDEEKKIFTISGGINVSNILNWLVLTTADACETDKPVNEFDSIDITLQGTPRNNIQADAIDFLLSDGYFKALKDCYQRILALKTGEGKTFCTIAAIARQKIKTCIIIHNEGLMKQWINSFVNFTDIKENEIYIIKGHSSVEKLLKMKKSDLSKYKIFLASHRTLSIIATTVPELLSKMFVRMRVGIKVFDEGHKEQKAVNLIDFLTNVNDTWYLTATPGRSDIQEQEIFSFCYATTPRFGEAMRYSDPYHYVWLVNFNTDPAPENIRELVNFYGFSYPKYVDYLFAERWEILARPFFAVLDKIVTKKGKIAILISKNNIIEILADLLRERYNNKYTVGTYCTLIKDKAERERELEAKIILSTEKSLGTGMDIKGLKFLMLFIPVKSDIIVEQILGRLREIPGEKVYFIDFCDFGFVQLVAQRKRRLKLYKKKAKQISNIEFRDEATIKQDNLQYHNMK